MDRLAARTIFGSRPAMNTGRSGNPVSLKSRAALMGNPETEPGWRLVEEGFTLAREHEIESVLAIANGYAGNRGSLAEGSSLSAPAQR
jgi:kojibiose phosphorylase